MMHAFRTAVEAQRLSKVFHLAWMWVEHSSKYPNIVDPLGDGSKGDWYLRPIMPPTDADADQGNIWTYGWSETRLCWMPKRQYRSLRQLDEKEGGFKGREMCAHYFEKIHLEG